VLDEVSLRRPEFDQANSAAVMFPGGMAFFLPKPAVRLRPVFRDGKRINETRLVTDDPEFDRLKEAVTAATDDDDADFGGAVINLAVYLLLKNYNIDDEQLGKAFEINMDGTSAGPTWMAEVMSIAYGRGPKA
jgi:hypothetical protein